MMARIATVSQRGSFCRSTQGNRDYMLKLLAAVFQHDPDLVCLPEAFTAKGVPAQTVAVVAESVPGPTTDALAKLARSKRAYIVCPIYTKRAGRFWNSAIIIDRTGSIGGIYDKAHPALSSADDTIFENGVTPGGPPPPFDFDFGRIGIQICLDASFPNDWRALVEQGAKAILWPSAFEGGLTLQAHALINHCYVVSAVRHGTARIINPCGRATAATSPGDNYALADINLDFIVAQQDFNHNLPGKVLAKYPERVKVTSHESEGLFLLEPLDDRLTTSQLQAEFGFESSAQSITRHLKAYATKQRG